jgi:F0F1-type ATP synthase membrane subunit c/vacuolar-type H+-ATPase subunit K
LPPRLSPCRSARSGRRSEGRAVAAAMEAISRQPEAARTLFVGLAMIETTAI